MFARKLLEERRKFYGCFVQVGTILLLCFGTSLAANQPDQDYTFVEKNNHAVKQDLVNPLILNNNRFLNQHHQYDDYHDLDIHQSGSQTTQDEHSTVSSGENSLSKSGRLPDKEYLTHTVADKACRLNRGCQRRDRFNNTYLSSCTRYKFENLLSNEILMSIMHESTEECDRLLDEFIQLDEMIEQFDSLFRKLLTRYNCHNGYSVKWSCEDCKRAYKDWLCATNLPYYMKGERIKPCISYCERVEQRCPYLHPIAKGQYGGQPVFICRDPNIPFVPEITPDIPYSEPTKCYDLCHLSDNITELIHDSLSKYDYDKCPDKGSIAEEVRSDPRYCKFGNRSLEEINTTASQLDVFETSSDFPTSDAGKEHRTKTKSDEVHVHLKKLNELKEVMTIYKSQPKTHSFAHHSPKRA